MGREKKSWPRPWKPPAKETARKSFLLGFGIDRAHASGPPSHRRRYRADAPGGRIENSGGGNFWSDKSGAQRAIRDAIDCPAKRQQYDRSRPASRTGTRVARNHRRRSRRRSKEAVAASDCRTFVFKNQVSEASQSGAQPSETAGDRWSRVARRIRVPLGFIFAVVYVWLARPTKTRSSWAR